MWKNKHVIVAMLVAPILAILAWVLVDHFVAEQPLAARAGGAYPLVARSNCRYDSGSCDLANADFEITLSPVDITDTEIVVALSSSHALQQATVGLVEGGGEQAPVRMSSTQSDARGWSATLTAPASDESVLRIAVIAGESTFFAEVPVVFMVIQ
jgi:hypothetical protein